MKCITANVVDRNNGRIVVTASTVEHSIKDSLECGRSCNAKAAAVIGEVLAMRLRVEGLEQGQGRGIHVDLNKEIEKKGFKNRTKIWPIVNSLRNNGVNLFWMMMITGALGLNPAKAHSAERTRPNPLTHQPLSKQKPIAL
ncbi:hypothetical protein CFP56_037285 [Quercus suber]|uniref:Ribosomal protein L18 n=1 Tax=Quercus suber TaxID=58331 RepID=A0AAW0J4Y2_QUESU